MLEGTNQSTSSSAYNLFPAVVSHNACTLMGNPTDRITLGYSVSYIGFSRAPLHSPSLISINLLVDHCESVTKPTQANTALQQVQHRFATCPQTGQCPNHTPQHNTSSQTQTTAQNTHGHHVHTYHIHFFIELDCLQSTTNYRHAHSIRPHTHAQTARTEVQHCRTLLLLSASAALLNSSITNSICLLGTTPSLPRLCRCITTFRLLYNIISICSILNELSNSTVRSDDSGCRPALVTQVVQAMLQYISSIFSLLAVSHSFSSGGRAPILVPLEQTHETH